jgi:alkanesulfonate monooxygenase SsuD/methylene tetrahydromethanopterin reductase-like flavin-dependent oxidoreductase (luciferase family)
MTLRRELDAPGSAVGIGGPAGGARGPRQLADAGRLAEASGFAWFGNGEHVLFHNPTSSALVNLSFLAGVTERIRLLSCVVLAPVYPAALLAKLAASVAILSEGRLELGIGVGGEFPAEFDACGVDPRTRGRRTDETIDVMRALWTGEPVRHEGRFWSFEGTLAPAPDRPPRIWVAGRTDAAVGRAAERGDVYMPYLVRPQRLREQLDTIDAAPRDVAVVPYVFLHLDADGDRARREAADWVGRTYRQDPAKFADLVIAGTAPDCAERLLEMREWGCAGAHLTLVSPPEDWAVRARAVGDDLLSLLA